MIPIINDDIAEPRKSFICALQGVTDDTIQAIFPSQVTINIHDDDGEHMQMLWPLKEHDCIVCIFISFFLQSWLYVGLKISMNLEKMK